MTNEEFFAGLTEADWDKAEAIESELGKLLKEGLSKDVGLSFVRTVMTVRKAVPDATVGGIFDQALNAGLGYFRDEGTLAQLRGDKPVKRKLKSTLK